MTTLNELAGSTWTGEAELWLDPLGDEARRSACTIAIEPSAVRYTWSYEGKPQRGALELRDGGAELSDTWHSPEPMMCEAVAGWTLLAVQGTYGAGEGPDWGWRTALSLRPMGEGQLVLQMTNIAPWGEEGRAVRMTCVRDAS